jgi:PAS domain S-box-containing protein
MASISADSVPRSETDFHTLAEVSHSATLIIQDGRIIYANPATATITGYSIDELIGKDVADLATPASRELILERRRRRQQGQEIPEQVELEYLTKNQEKRWVEYHASFLTLDGKATTIVNATDITKRKQAEAAIRELLSREQGARFEAEVIRDAGSALSQNLSLERVLETLLEYAGKLVPFDRARVLLSDEDSFVVCAARGYKGTSILGSRLTLTDHPVLQTLHKTQRAVLVADTENDPDWKLDTDERVHSWLSVPLVVSGLIVGLYTLEKTEPGFFTPEHVRLAETIAPQAASAIRNAQLFRESQHHAEELEKRIAERERAEQALSASESFRRTVIESEPECVKLVGRDCELLDMNPAGLQMIGADSLEQVVGRSVVSLIAPEWKRNYEEMNRDVFAGESIVSQFEIIGLNGVRRWMESHAVPLRNENSEVIAQLAVARDVTEQIRSEQALRASEERYRELFENAKDALYVHDLEGRFTSVNHAAEKLIGYQRDDIIGKSFGEFFPPGELETVKESLLRKFVKRGETSYETEVIAKNGRRVPVEVSSRLIFEDGSPVGIQGAARDITERKRVEEALKQSEREYRGLFENAHDAILVIDPETETVLEVNPRACEMYGIKRSDFLGMSLKTISKDEKRGRLRIEETLRAGVSHNFETVQRRGDGTEMFLQVNAAVVEYNGRVAIQSINRDVTEQRRAEEALKNYPRQLIQAQEGERQNIARELHDQIGQVLTAVQLNLNSVWQLCDTSATKALVAEGVSIIDEAIGQVRDLSFELRPSLLDDLGLIAAVRWYADRFSHRTGIEVSTAIDLPPDSRLNRDLETACFRIVQESLTNIARHARARSVSIVLHYIPEGIYLSITDDGIGFEVDSENLTQFAAHVGLRGMRERALALGGKFEVSSANMMGTRIQALLPMNNSS